MDLVVPEITPDFFMDRLVAENCQLPVLNRQVNQDRISFLRLAHFEAVKYFGCPIQRVDKATAAFHVDPDFSAGPLFGMLDRLHNAVIFFF
jgi:hypothetical protein